MMKQIDEPFLRSWGFGKHNEDSKCTGFMIEPLRTVALPTELHVDIFDDGHVEVLLAQTVGKFKHYVRMFDNLVSISQAESLFSAFCLKKEKVMR